MKWFMHTGAGLHIVGAVQVNRDLNFTSCWRSSSYCPHICV